MPELPEVKTIQDQLTHYLPFKVRKITTSDVVSSIVHTELKEIKNKTLLKINRRGKLLDFQFDQDWHLLSHLGMTGTWIYSEEPIKEKHNHVILSDGKRYLNYVDPRRFGHMYFYQTNEAQEKMNELGIDLLAPEFTEKYLRESLQKYPDRYIKVSLLDQKLFAGTGNYIANEICAHAGVRPARRVATLKPREFKKLYEGFGKTLAPAVDSGGTTFQGGYRDAYGNKGLGVRHLVVFYQKVCQLCKKEKVVKITLGQRGTYYCPKCQK